MATIEMFTSKNEKGIKSSSKAIHDSEKRIFEATGNIEKPHQEVKEVLNDFRISFDKNTNNMNNVIEGFRSSLKEEK